MLTAINVKTTRTYTMRARAEATVETRGRILDAVIALFEERLSLEVVLADVAERAGVSVQTVLRHYGSKEDLFAAARARQHSLMVEERAVPVGDVPAAVSTIVAFYERVGDWVLWLLAQEHVNEPSRAVVQAGRRVHRDWVGEVFAPQLDGGRDRRELVDLLVIATDVYTWKLLRRDSGLDRATTGKRMLRLVRAVLPASSEGG